MAVPVYAQYTYRMAADSFRISNNTDTAELILENRTKDIPGFLFNKSAGITIFRKLKLAIPGKNLMSIDGQDTLNIGTTMAAWGDNRYDLSANNFTTFPYDSSALWNAWPLNKVVGYDAYRTPGMPSLSDQAFQGRGSNLYYNGLVVRNNNTGFDFAINWDGELQGPNGAFLRIKDSSATKWSNWRELLFKDYLDNNFLRNEELDSVYISSTIFNMKEYANDARMGVVTVASGQNTITINTSAITANSRIFLTIQNGTITKIGVGPAGIPFGNIASVTARVPGSSFTISVLHGTSSADVAWMIIEPY